MSVQWLYLAVAIVATSMLKATESFTRLGPSLIVVAGYVIAFYFLTLTLKTLPAGVAYAVWSGDGIVLTTLVAWFWHKQTLDLPAIIGMGLIIAGVLVMNLFSRSDAH